MNPSSLLSVATAWHELTSPGPKADVAEAWKLVAADCRPRSVYDQLTKVLELAARMWRGYTADQQEALSRSVESRAEDVLYDGVEGGRTPIASTADNGAAGAAVFFYYVHQDGMVGATRFVKRDGHWMVDLRSGGASSETASIYGPQSQCPS